MERITGRVRQVRLVEAPQHIVDQARAIVEEHLADEAFSSIRPRLIADIAEAIHPHGEAARVGETASEWAAPENEVFNQL